MKFMKLGSKPDFFQTDGDNIRMDPKQLDPRHCGELLKLLDKQNEFLMESYKSMFQELQKLQVEEEMLMHKLYEVMFTHGLTKKNKDNSEGSNNSGALG